MYHKNENKRTLQPDTKNPEKTVLEKWGRRVPPTKQCYGAASTVLRPASVSIYKDKKFYLRQLRVHPLG